jgi:predicted RNA-binding Zn ribbon-like protein
MSEVVVKSLPTYRFDFSGDHLCLDFTNTLSDRLLEKPREHLNSYDDLLAWSVQAEVLTFEEATELQEIVQGRSHEGEEVLERAIELRESLFRIFMAVAQEGVPADEDLQFLSKCFAETMAKGHLSFEGEQCNWRWQVADALDSMLWEIIRGAESLLTAKELLRVRVCASDDCNWLFLDTSKNHSRRWCDMKGCGNRAKVRKFYERGRKKQELSVEEG